MFWSYMAPTLFLLYIAAFAVFVSDIGKGRPLVRFGIFGAVILWPVSLTILVVVSLVAAFATAPAGVRWLWSLFVTESERSERERAK